ncbi:MAG: hypothetical protein II838_05405 [Lachnospiraceae bacterium]|nr:hypothetical protein [Lachnospiraceae bacterium]
MYIYFQHSSKKEFVFHIKNNTLSIHPLNTSFFQSPIAITNTYLSHISLVEFRGQISCSFVNTNGTLTILTISIHPITVKSTYESHLTLFSPCLTIFQKHLLLLYLTKENTTTIHITNPFEPDFHLQLEETEPLPDFFTTCESAKELYLTFPSLHIPHIYKITATLTLEKISFENTVTNTHNINGNNANTSTINQDRILYLEETIKRASAQYNALMETAQKYRAEAQKWHNLYISSISQK